jgi:SpoVK/Ycf46/Vps4 family AAA+-type ATPase
LSQIGLKGEEGQANRKAAAAAILGRLDTAENDKEAKTEDGGRQRRRKKDIELNQYEQLVAMDVVAPDDIPVTFEGGVHTISGPCFAETDQSFDIDIGGLGDIIEELKESVIYPLTMPHIYSRTSSLLSAPSGVLLYGPPGCGKTMLAKALAHESGATFINLHISTLTAKWYGDSNKLVKAAFSLAAKLEPSIVFIDEIDALLGTRRTGEHEATGTVKAEFMTLWDGLTSASPSGGPQRIVVLGATNRIGDIDDAILRRMPKKFAISLPSAPQRLRILGLILKDTRLDKPNFDLEYLVRVTAGMSGSDLKALCRDAAMVPLRELIKEKQASGAHMSSVDPNDIRGLRTSDFFRSPGGQLVQVPKSEITEESASDVEASTSEPSDVEE